MLPTSGERGCRILYVRRGPICEGEFPAIILGGTGQVGGAAVAELLAIPECGEVVYPNPDSSRSLRLNLHP